MSQRPGRILRRDPGFALAPRGCRLTAFVASSNFRGQLWSSIPLVEEDHIDEPQTNQRLTVAQGATSLGITEGAVRSRVPRARSVVPWEACGGYSSEGKGWMPGNHIDDLDDHTVQGIWEACLLGRIDEGDVLDDITVRSAGVLAEKGY
jgi:hypothetical protein